MQRVIVMKSDLVRPAGHDTTRERGTSSDVVEESSSAVLADVHARPVLPAELPVSPCTGGVQPGVDLTRNAALRDVMDGL